MLERTAATLEPCNFQRVLPPTKTSFTSRRRLHTAFWQHGAADIELSSVWQTLVREPLESLNPFPASKSKSQSSPSSKTESMSASSFLLDFLYPHGATALLRKLSPSVLDKYERPKLYFRRSLPRLFTSSASPSQESRIPSQETTATGPAASEDQDVSAHHDVSARVRISTNEQVEDKDSDLDAEVNEELDEEGQSEQGSHVQEKFNPRKSVLALSRFLELLPKDDRADFDNIWRAYHVMTLNDKKAHRTRFLDYVVIHRDLNQLLAQAFKSKEWETLWGIWEWFPPAQTKHARPLRFEELERVLNIDQLMSGALSIAAKIQNAEKQTQLSHNLRKKVVYPIVAHCVKLCKPELYIKRLNQLKDHVLYEEFLESTTGAFNKQVLDQLYTDYRKLPGVKIRGHIMHVMINNVYYPDNPVGMEKVMADFYARFGRLDIGTYRKCLDFYTRRGDLASVTRLWDEYKMHYAKERAPPPDYVMTAHSRPDFIYMLQVHAVRGELGEVRRVFSQAQSEFGPNLNAFCWNILLNAHAKATEYDAAVRVFGVLRHAVKPDLYSYGTMMGMTGSRGDLEFTLELYRMAKSERLRPNVTMVDCVVEAYCQNDKFNDAENIVTMTTEEKRFPPEELVYLWNTLLSHHSSRRDLTTVNRLLNQMTEHEITYDAETYNCLLRGLALCKQPHHALYLVQQAVKAHSFKPTLQHYGLLMSAFAQSGQPGEVLRTSRILYNLGIPKSADILVRVFQALGSFARSPPGGPDAHRSQTYLASALHQFRQSIESSQKPEKARLPHGSPDSRPWLEQTASPNIMRARTDQVSVLIFTFTQLRQVTTVPEILQLWKASSPETANMQQPPLKLLQSLMLAAFYDRNYDEVREIWRLVLDRATHMSRVSAPGTRRAEALPSLRYVLCDPLKTMQRACAATSDVEGLREAVASVQRAGFRLDSKNWNYYVQLLAEQKKWREAFVVCEEQLMPYWRGWQRVRARRAGVRTNLPLEMRRRGNDPHNPRPISYTLIVLSKAYMDLEQMSAWSTEAERLLAYIVAKAPSAINAVHSQLRSNDRLEVDILGATPWQLEKEARRKKARDAQAEAEAVEKDMPEAFQEMMLKAGSGEGLDTVQGGWGWDDEGEGEVDDGAPAASTNETAAAPAPAPAGEAIPRMDQLFDDVMKEVERKEARRRARELEETAAPAAATAEAHAAAPDVDSDADEWSDVNEQDDDTWTPMGPPGHEEDSSDWDEVRDAEASIWGGRAEDVASPAPDNRTAGQTHSTQVSFDAERAFLRMHTKKRTVPSKPSGVKEKKNTKRKGEGNVSGKGLKSEARMKQDQGNSEEGEV